jgi:hypothetical protein
MAIYGDPTTGHPRQMFGMPRFGRRYAALCEQYPVGTALRQVTPSMYRTTKRPLREVKVERVIFGRGDYFYLEVRGSADKLYWITPADARRAVVAARKGGK